MARRTVYIPDDLDERVLESGSVDDSYSSIVTQALREYLAKREAENGPQAP